MLPSLWTFGRLPSLPRAPFPSLRCLAIPGFEIASGERLVVDFRVLFHALCSTEDKLVILPREYSSPTLEVLEALCNTRGELGVGEESEALDFGKEPGGLKLSNLVMAYYSARPRPCHCEYELQLSEQGTIDVENIGYETYPNTNERWNVTHLFKRFLDTFPTAHLSICSC